MDVWTWLTGVALIVFAVVVIYFVLRPRRDEFYGVEKERRRLRELGKAAGWRS